MAKAKTAEVSEKKLSKRKRKRGARTPQTKTKTKTKAAASQAAPDDTMSQCVALCQKQAWREAMLLCLKMGAKAIKVAVCCSHCWFFLPLFQHPKCEIPHLFSMLFGTLMARHRLHWF